MVDIYTESQVNTLVILNVIASTFSFLGATFIIANFFVFSEFKRKLSFKLILFVAIGDILNSVGNFMGSPQDGSVACILQALLTQFGDIVSFAWVTAIAVVVYMIMSRAEPPTPQDAQSWYKKIHLIIWPTTIILSILPFTTDNYGYDNGLCWITFDPKPTGELWRWVCFYIPLWGCIIVVSVLYWRVWDKITAPEIQRKSSGAEPPTSNATQATSTTDVNVSNKEKEPERGASAQDVYHESGGGHASYPSDQLDTLNEQSTTDIHKTPKSGGGILQRVKFYPFVLFGCYLFATIRRIAEFADSDSHLAPFGIAACQVFTSALLGTCNALLYGFTPVVREKDTEWIRSKCCGGANGDENEDGDIGNDEIR